MVSSHALESVLNLSSRFRLNGVSAGQHPLFDLFRRSGQAVDMIIDGLRLLRRYHHALLYAESEFEALQPASVPLLGAAASRILVAWWRHEGCGTCGSSLENMLHAVLRC